MDKRTYELIRDLTELAINGKDAMAADADGPEDRRLVAEAECTIIRGQYIVNEYEEAHRHGDLPDA